MTVDSATPQHTVVLVTGPSGAGRSTAIRRLEDLGYEAIDNLPLPLLPRLLEGTPHEKPIALGIDTRTRGFSVAGFLDVLNTLGTDARVTCRVLYIDCRPEVLSRRYSETRRRHPLARAESPDEGIARELDLLAPIRDAADLVIDSSDLTLHELRAQVAELLSNPGGLQLALSLQSFSYKRGLPQGLDLVFDTRFLRNPYWVEALRPGTGRDPEVAAYVAGDPRFELFFDRLLELLRVLLPAYRDEGKSHLSIGFGCTGGRHRSVATVEKLAAALAAEKWQVSIRHRDVDRPGAPNPAASKDTA